MVVLDRLRKAVRKLTFFLNPKNYLSLSQSTLGLATLIRAPATIASRPWRRRAFSFNDRPGLRACVEIEGADHDNSDEEDEHDHEYGRSRGSSGTSSPYPLLRTRSHPLERDVDKEADMFIDNFYKHLIFEKQVSLNLRYCRDDSSFNSSGDSVVSPLSSAGSQLVSPI